METTVNERVVLIKKHLDLTDVEFCNRANISTGTLFRIKNGESISPKVLKSISEGTQTELHWLKTGKGKMLIEKDAQTIANPWKDAFVVELKEKNTFLEKQVEWLQSLVNNLTQKGANPNFLKALERAGVPANFLGGTYSGAKAA